MGGPEREISFELQRQTVKRSMNLLRKNKEQDSKYLSMEDSVLLKNTEDTRQDEWQQKA